MTPQDERVHEFVRDLNKAIQRYQEWDRQDVPSGFTDDWRHWQQTRNDLEETVHELRDQVSKFFYNL
jgi:uncharacterized protein YukE